MQKFYDVPYNTLRRDKKTAFALVQQAFDDDKDINPVDVINAWKAIYFGLRACEFLDIPSFRPFDWLWREIYEEAFNRFLKKFPEIEHISDSVFFPAEKLYYGKVLIGFEFEHEAIEYARELKDKGISLNGIYYAFQGKRGARKLYRIVSKA